jgi:endoglucanase
MRLHLALVTILAALLAACSPVPKSEHGGNINPALWQSFKQGFMRDDGRVVDAGNGDISHSEGQGYAMLLAVAANDPDGFARLWAWTHTRLRRPDDVFFAWRWVPDVAEPISDLNNASDGDVLIAWALSRAAARWNEPGYRDEARTLAAAIRQKLTRRTAYGLVLLPGIHGFEHPEGLSINLSYWIFPAFTELELIDPSPAWHELTASGQNIIQQARFGKTQLPPDWLQISPQGALQPAPAHPARFGFDALRIPLYACWGHIAIPEFYAAVAAQWSSQASPAWIDLNSGETAPYPLTSGALAVRQLMQRCLTPPAKTSITTPALPLDDYYSSVLILLSQLAQNELAK